MENKPQVVIVGAGFGGIELAKSLRRLPVDVLLIDRNNYHNFQPLMYQVATGGLEPDSIAYPVRRIFRRFRNVRCRMAEVSLVDWERSRLFTSIGTVPYDYLVIATGSRTNYFNFESLQDRMLTLKSLPDALNLRSFVYQNLEKAIANYSGEPLEEIMNIAIVGGGPAGIELAGALAEMKKHVIPRDFPDLDTSLMSINLYQSGDRVLKAMSEIASEKAREYLEDLGVNVLLNSRVADYRDDQVHLSDGTRFPTDTVIWTAGVRAAPLNGLPESCLLKGNRIAVDPCNRVAGLDNVFAIGDVAACIAEATPRGLPMLAPVAQQQGRHLAGNLGRLLRRRDLVPFVYRDRGAMATVGRARAVADLPNWKFQGTFAWVVWMAVHIYSLVGFRNKLSALYHWAFNYLSYDRPLGLIIRPYRREAQDAASDRGPGPGD
ncbi:MULTISPECIES: NAD(P)/FAD-dependent oxidoreductase [unclassified Robiginitalea]|uniref:NAD(P)/FAD-dependent oxidoreductase n=1 Tax=Robiginitalea TaxID=252306 RepID=UPI002349A931|nr:MULTISPECIES: NAD(P)/FAD-dependent oxidoreductase [unclassified Robiginitalea]MDC6354594.1 NAD(P)/FAD-dependent oxidoreductase [Robiginitalea sp. PM2]MDC6374724.1 NAD(P)/FAD-dependent oxidoreductase [Robiginitalea sp. SP8]